MCTVISAAITIIKISPPTPLSEHSKHRLRKHYFVHENCNVCILNCFQFIFFLYLDTAATSILLVQMQLSCAAVAFSSNHCRCCSFCYNVAPLCHRCFKWQLLLLVLFCFYVALLCHCCVTFSWSSNCCFLFCHCCRNTPTPLHS